MKTKIVSLLGSLAMLPAVAFAQYGAGVNLLPNTAFLIAHLLGLLVGLFLAWKAMSWQGGMKKFVALFVFYAVAELLYILAHVGSVDVYFAHQVGETLLLIGALVSVWGVMKK